MAGSARKANPALVIRKKIKTDDFQVTYLRANQRPDVGFPARKFCRNSLAIFITVSSCTLARRLAANAIIDDAVFSTRDSISSYFSAQYEFF